MPIALRGPRKAMRGKCERGRGGCGSHSAEGRILRGRHRRACGGSVNAGAEVQTRTGRVRKSSRAMGTRRRRLSAPWLQFHGADRADVYIIIHVRACCCGECALNPPTSPPIPRRRPSLAPAQRHALPEHFRSPTSPDACPQAARCIPRRPHNTFPAEDFFSPPHSDTPSPSTSAPPRSPDARPRSADAHPQAARCIPRRPHNPFPAQRHAASPSVPLRAQKNGTAQCMCDAECLGRPSLRSVIWVGEPRAVRRRCGALACRRGA